MRVRNKELRQRWHRKEQLIKQNDRELREKYGDKKTAPAAGTTKAAAKPAAAKKPAAKKKAEGE